MVRKKRLSPIVAAQRTQKEYGGIRLRRRNYDVSLRGQYIRRPTLWEGTVKNRGRWKMG